MLKPDLSKEGERIRRRIMHHITRHFSAKGDKDFTDAWHVHYKPIVAAAVTTVLAEEERKRDRRVDSVG